MWALSQFSFWYSSTIFTLFFYLMIVTNHFVWVNAGVKSVQKKDIMICEWQDLKLRKWNLKYVLMTDCVGIIEVTVTNLINDPYELSLSQLSKSSKLFSVIRSVSLCGRQGASLIYISPSSLKERDIENNRLYWYANTWGGIQKSSQARLVTIYI